MPTVSMPGDKSLSHRALILAALAEGESRLRGVLRAADPASTASILRALGAEVPELGDEIRIRGRGLRGLREPLDALDCGNSGTTARLMLGVLAAQPLSAVLTGDDSLRSRPMRRVTEPLATMGARLQELGGPDRLPIRVQGGPLRDMDYVSPTASAQVKSALLLAGLCGGVPVRVREPVRSRDHTERLLSGLGVPVRVDDGGPDAGPGVAIEPVERLGPLDLAVPGDFSSAAFFLALTLLAPGGEIRITGIGVNPTRTGLLGVLARMGADVASASLHDEGGEPVADLVARATPLRGVTVTADEIPSLIDEVPVLAMLAARAHGETRITGAAELRVKESDRLTALATNLAALGVEVEEAEDGLTIQGTDRPLAGRVLSYGDHRIAMAFAVLAALPGTDIVLDDDSASAISFPDFRRSLRDVADALRQGR